MPTTSSATATPTPTTVVASGDLFVGPIGSESNSGTQNSPLTLSAAISKLAAGKTIYLLDGTYKLSATGTIAYGNNGSANALKTIAAYSGAKPLLKLRTSLALRQRPGGVT